MRFCRFPPTRASTIGEHLDLEGLRDGPERASMEGEPHGVAEGEPPHEQRTGGRACHVDPGLGVGHLDQPGTVEALAGEGVPSALTSITDHTSASVSV